MGFRVYNALGGTPETPCPTRGGAAFCNLADVRSWREAAARLYDRAILPTWTALLEVSTSAPEAGSELDALHKRVTDYVAAFNELPGASLLSSDKNLERVTAIIALMGVGDALVDDIQAAIAATGNTAPAVLLPAPPPEPLAKHAASRWLLPVGASVGVLVVIGLSAAAAVSYARRRRSEGEGARRARAA